MVHDIPMKTLKSFKLIVRNHVFRLRKVEKFSVEELQLIVL